MDQKQFERLEAIGVAILRELMTIDPAKRGDTNAASALKRVTEMRVEISKERTK